MTEYERAVSDVVAFDLSDWGRIEIVGPEARMFLHNLCTNDVTNLPVGGGCEAFLTNHKAKTLAIIYLRAGVKDGEPALTLDVPPGLSDKVFQHLNRHLISERCEILDLGADATAVRVAGPGARAAVEQALERRVEWQAWQWEAASDVLVRCTPLLSVEAFDVWNVPALRYRVAANQVHEILRVEAGTPVYGVDVDEDRFVVEVGRTRQAISYTKGCYLGQEPIVMARDRGQVNRTLLGLKLALGELPAAGAKVFAGDAEVGVVTSAVESPRFGPIALAYLRRGHQTVGTAVQVGGREATVSALPFG